MSEEPGHAPPDSGDWPPLRAVTDDQTPVRQLRLQPASQIRMRPVYWTWTDRIPAASITVIPGREGIGKSLTLAWLAAQLTTGTLPGVHHGKPRSVIYAATEDSWGHTIAPRLYAAGADLDRVFRVDVETDGIAAQLTLPTDCERLAREIERYDVAMLAADPLLSLIHGSIDTHRDRDLRTALEPLATMADKTACSVVGLAHFNKSANTDALSLITGSRAFSAVARAVIAIARDDEAEDGTCVMSQAKSNLGTLNLPSLAYRIDSAAVPTDDGPAHVGRLVMTGESERSVNDILAAAGTSTRRTSKTRAVAWLRDYLEAVGGSAPAAEVTKAAQAEGIAVRTLQRALDDAEVDTTREGFPAASYWLLRPSRAKAAPIPGDSGATGATGVAGTRPSTTPHAELNTTGTAEPLFEAPAATEKRTR
ncbi:MAG: AAA family ATPase [Nocardioides sp.]